MKALMQENPEHFYLECAEILLDDETHKYERILWTLKPETEPITKIDEDPYCKRCNEYKLINEKESLAVCIFCGEVQPIFIFYQDYADRTYERTGYNYKRITHFRKHWRDLSNKIGKLRIDEYYERACLMFNRVQALFNKYKPADRRNFFNYQYILIKFFELFKRPDIRNFMTYLKSKEKLNAHDDIWRDITYELGWNFIPSKRIIEHKRKYKKRIRFRRKKKK